MGEPSFGLVALARAGGVWYGGSGRLERAAWRVRCFRANGHVGPGVSLLWAKPGRAS